MENYFNQILRIANKEVLNLGNQELVKFIYTKKLWTTKNFVKLTHAFPEQIKFEISAIIFIELLKNKPLPYKRLWNCKDLILYLLNSTEPEVYLNYLYSSLKDNVEKSIKSVIYSIKLLKALNFPQSELSIKLENTLMIYLKNVCKKIIMKNRMSQIIKYLGVAMETITYIDSKTECCIIVTAGLQVFNEKFSLFSEVKKNFNNASRGQLLYTGLVFHYILNYLKDFLPIKDLITPFLCKFEADIMRKENISPLSEIRPYPYLKKFKDDLVLFDMNMFQLTWTYSKSHLPNLVLTYNQAKYENLDVLLVIYEFENLQLKESFKYELVKIMQISKLSSQNNCLQKLLAYYEFNNNFYLIYDPYYPSLIDILTQVKVSRQVIHENLVKKIAKCLIYSFYRLEKDKIVHGNVKPHHIFCNEKWEIKISCFPCVEGIDYDEKMMNDNLIQGLFGYSAPDVPTKFDFTFDYKDKKADVFSVGMVLLQIVTLDSIEGLNKNERRLYAVLNELPFMWLQNLLRRMLAFKGKNRISFKEIYRERASIFS